MGEFQPDTPSVEQDSVFTWGNAARTGVATLTLAGGVVVFDGGEVADATTAAVAYVDIQPGNTLTSIAAGYCTDVDALLGANPEIADRDEIRAGDTLTVPVGAGCESPSWVHIVEPGDTLFSIAGSLEGAEELQRINDIEDPSELAVGQKLILNAEEAQIEPSHELTAEQLALIDSMDLNTNQKHVLRTIYEVGSEAQAQGYKVNITALMGMVYLESLLGESKVAQHHNYAGEQVKPGEPYDGDFFWGSDVDKDGNRYAVRFEKHPSTRAGIWSIIHRLDEGTKWSDYDDAKLHFKDTRLFLDALSHRLDAEGNIIKEDFGSWSAHGDYTRVTIGIIERFGFDTLTGGR